LKARYCRGVTGTLRILLTVAGAVKNAILETCYKITSGKEGENLGADCRTIWVGIKTAQIGFSELMIEK